MSSFTMQDAGSTLTTLGITMRLGGARVFPEPDGQVIEAFAAAKDPEALANLLAKVFKGTRQQLVRADVEDWGRYLSDWSYDKVEERDFLWQTFLEGDETADLYKEATALMDLLSKHVGGKVFFMLSIDEAQELPATQSAVLRRFWSPTDCQGRWQWSMPPGLFLVLSGPSQELSILAPTARQSGSGRIIEGVLQLADPFTALAIQHPRLPPQTRVSSLVATFPRIGRQLWSSILADELQDTIAVFFPTLASGAKISRDDALAALAQRIVVGALSAAEKDHPYQAAPSHRDTLSPHTEHRLSWICGLSSYSDWIRTEVISEPMVAWQIAQWTLTRPQGYHELIECLHQHLTSRSMDSGAAGEMLAQLAWLMAVDEHRFGQAGDDTREGKFAVPLLSVMKGVVPVANHTDLNKLQNGQITLLRFRAARREHKQLTQSQLLRLWERGEGLVGRSMQKGWDLLTPVCLDQPRTLNEAKPKMTWVIVQAKNQIDGPEIQRKYYAKSAFPSSDAGTLQELLVYMEFNGRRTAETTFTMQPLHQMSLRGTKKGKELGRANQWVLGVSGQVAGSPEGPGRCYPVLHRHASSSLFHDIARQGYEKMEPLQAEQALLAEALEEDAW